MNDLLAEISEDGTMLDLGDTQVTGPLGNESCRLASGRGTLCSMFYASLRAANGTLKRQSWLKTVLVAALVVTHASANAEPAVIPAKDIASFLISQFDRFDVVAMGELHTSRADLELRIELIHHKEFATKVGIVVMEGLNALYQSDLDRYVRGEDVPREQIQKVWRDGTQVFSGPTMLTEYEQFLKEIRSANQSLGAGPKIRVIAADPPINWAKVHTHDEFMPILRERGDFGLRVITAEVLQKRKKALLVVGLGGFTRNQQMQTPHGFVPLAPTIGGHIDSEFPGRLYVVTPIRSAVYPHTARLEQLIGSVKLPVLLQLRGTEFGALDPNEFIPAHASMLTGAPAPPFHPFRDGLTMASVADACIYRGRSPDLTLKPDPAYRSDTAFAAEIARRARIAEPPGR
jgi:hypothetical protein